jgi:protease-4
MDIQKKSSNKVFWGIIIGVVVIAVIFVGIAFLVLASKIVSHGNGDYYYEYTGSGDGKIGIVDLDFTIVSSDPIVRQFKKFREDKSIKAIVLRINSPGGGVAASQEMYEEIKKTRDAGKPVIVSFASIAASGGYYTACGGSIIVSNPGTLTGSIGVIGQFVSIKELADKLGIKYTTVKSGELKDAGSPFRDVNQADLDYFNDIIKDSYEQFLDVVAKERKIDKEELRKIANGRVFTGLQAKKLKLVDTIGTFQDAIKIAADMAGIKGEPVLVREKMHHAVLDLFFNSSNNSELKQIKEEFQNEFLNSPVLQYKFENK